MRDSLALLIDLMDDSYDTADHFTLCVNSFFRKIRTFVVKFRPPVYMFLIVCSWFGSIKQRIAVYPSLWKIGLIFMQRTQIHVLNQNCICDFLPYEVIGIFNRYISLFPLKPISLFLFCYIERVCSSG